MTSPSPLATRPYHGNFSFVDALPFFVDLPRFLAQTNFQNPTDSSRTVHQLTRNTCLDAFDWMKENPKHYEILNRFMAANRMIRTGIDAFPFEDKVPYLARKGDQQSKLDSTTPLFVDIGGGRGQMSRVFRSKFPHSPGRIILQDLPQTLANAVPSDCIEAMAHDFFGPQPIKGAKVYFTRHVLHDWPDSKAEVILKRVVEAMDKESVLLIDEKVLPDVGASNSAAGLDLLMMTIFAAQERSEKDWRALLGRAGLRIEYIFRYNEDVGDSIIMAVPADQEGKVMVNGTGVGGEKSLMENGTN